jgi:hypothetical protein
MKLNPLVLEAKPFNFLQFFVYVSDDALHAYYTTHQTTFSYKEQSHVDGLACCKQEQGWSDERSC